MDGGAWSKSGTIWLRWPRRFTATNTTTRKRFEKLQQRLSMNIDFKKNAIMSRDGRYSSVPGRRTLVSSAILLALATTQATYAAEGDALDAGAPILVNQTTAGDQAAAQSKGDVAMDANGNFVAVWTDWSNYDGSEVVARRFNADGTPRGGEFLVNTTTTGNQTANGVAVSPNGAFVVVFKDQTDFSIYARRFDADGVALGDQLQVNTNTGGVSSQNAFSQVAMAADGSFVVVWAVMYTGMDRDVLYRRFAFDGTALDATEQRANTITSLQQSDPVIAMNPAGNYVITWDDNASGDNDIRARRYSASGTALDAVEVLVNETTAGFQVMPAVAMDADGNYTVAWHSNNSVVYFKRYAADGSTLNPETAVMRDTDFASPPLFWDVSVAMSADGDFVIAASDYVNSDGDGYGSYMQRYDNTGNAFYVSPVNVGGPAGSDFLASVKMDADGDTVALYQNYDGDDGSGYGVYAERYEGGSKTVDLSLVGAGESDTFGDRFTYTYTVTNNGSGYALAVKLEDVLPSGVSYTSFTSLDGWSCSETSGTVSCTLPSLAPAAHSSIDITVDTSGVTDSAIDNTATISNAVTDSNTSNNSDTVSATATVGTSGGGGGLSWLGLLFGLLPLWRRR